MSIRRRCLTMAVLFVFSLSFTTCSSSKGDTGIAKTANSPEGAVRAYMDSFSAHDQPKFASIWSPDHRDWATSMYGILEEEQREFGDVSVVVTRDDPDKPRAKVVTVEVMTKTRWDASLEKRSFQFLVEQLNGQWYVSDGRLNH